MPGAGGEKMEDKQRTGTGLVSYGGDSEISDSEDERTSWSSSPKYPTAASVVIGNTLGIPTSKTRQPSSPPSFVRPEVHPAPLTGLVDYRLDDDEDPDNSIKEFDTSMITDEVFTVSNSTVLLQPNEVHKDKQLKEFEEKVKVSSLETVLNDDSSSELSTIKEEHKICLFLPLSDTCLPPEPQGRCSNSLVDKIVSLLKRKAEGVDLGESIQNRKDFRNPSIYEKLVNFCKLDEFGSNYPDDATQEWSEESLYKNLRKAQMKAYEKKERAKLERTKVEFVTGTKRPALGGSKSAEAVKKPRRSKWDISAGSESGGSRGGSPHKERPPLLGAAPRGMQPLSVVGAQAKVQATQLNKELARLKNNQ